MKRQSTGHGLVPRNAQPLGNVSFLEEDFWPGIVSGLPDPGTISGIATSLGSANVVIAIRAGPGEFHKMVKFDIFQG